MYNIIIIDFEVMERRLSLVDIDDASCLLRKHICTVKIFTTFAKFYCSFIVVLVQILFPSRF